MPDTRALLVIANPTSGRGRGRKIAQAVANDLTARGISVCIQFTQRRGDAESFARSRCENPNQPVDAIVACGGDGTIQEVAHALASARQVGVPDVPALGLAPAGRCNDFTRVFKITRDPKVIADALVEGNKIEVDLGRVNDRFFCTVATVGIDAEISNFVDNMRMPLTGTPAYLYGALRVLMKYQPRGLRIEGDFGVIDEPVFVASAANTSSYGGAVPIAPGASPRDGLLDLCVIQYMSKWRALRIIPHVLRGTHTMLPEVRFLQTTSVTVSAASRLELWADGERIGQTPATIEIVPSAIVVISSRTKAWANAALEVENCAVRTASPN